MSRYGVFQFVLGAAVVVGAISLLMVWMMSTSLGDPFTYILASIRKLDPACLTGADLKSLEDRVKAYDDGSTVFGMAIGGFGLISGCLLSWPVWIGLYQFARPKEDEV